MNKFARGIFYRMSTSISEDLLISISMASHKNFLTQQELADHYQQIELITDDTLHQSFAGLDRALFSSDKSQNLYGNHLIKLNQRDNMTTPIMHAFPANELVKHINHGDRILDAGTGYGYFAFLMAAYIKNNALENVEIVGMDVEEHLIANCERIQGELVEPLVKFRQENILSCLTLDYNLINVGFGIDEHLVKQIQRISSPEVVHLICPLMEDNSTEQWLTYLRITKDDIERKKLMKCLFQSAKQITNQNQHLQVEQKIRLLQQKEKQIELDISQWNKAYQDQHKTKPTLSEMRKDLTLMQMLKDLKDLKREIRIAQRPME